MIEFFLGLEGDEIWRRQMEEQELYEALFGLEPEDYDVKEGLVDYYITLQGMPFSDYELLRCHYCSGPIEAYDGKLERAYVWFMEEEGEIECCGLVCKRCAERRIFPVKPYPTTEEERKHIQRILSMRPSKPNPYFWSKVNR